MTNKSTDDWWGGPVRVSRFRSKVFWLVDWTPLKSISQLGWFFPIIWENKKCSKPPTSLCVALAKKCKILPRSHGDALSIDKNETAKHHWVDGTWRWDDHGHWLSSVQHPNSTQTVHRLTQKLGLMEVYSPSHMVMTNRFWPLPKCQTSMVYY